MKSILDMPENMISPLLMIVVSLFWVMFFILVIQYRTNVPKWKRVSVVILIIVEYAYFQMIFGVRYKKTVTIEWVNGMVEKISFPVFVLTVLLMAGLMTYFMIDFLRWTANRVTDMSIKESLDALPDGVCIYTASGIPLLVNPAMEKISNKYFGGALTHGLAFEQELENRIGRKLSDNVKLLGFEDGEYYMASINKIIIENVECREIIMSNVTDVQETNRRLAQENERLKAMNERLQELSKTIDEVTIEGEILDAKVMVHDYLGQVLIATKSFLVERQNQREAMKLGENIGLKAASGPAENLGVETASESGENLGLEAASGPAENLVVETASESAGNESDQQDADRLLGMWRESIAFMRNMGYREKKDEYLQLLATAEDVGVTFNMEGDLPVEKDVRHIVVRAMHECMTNTIRYAEGDELYIRIIDNRVQDEHGDSAEIGKSSESRKSGESGKSVESRKTVESGKLVESRKSGESRKSAMPGAEDKNNEGLRRYRYRVIIKNNGKPPETAVQPKGGLASLQQLVEKNNGNMRIVSEEEFVLLIDV